MAITEDVVLYGERESRIYVAGIKCSVEL